MDILKWFLIVALVVFLGCAALLMFDSQVEAAEVTLSWDEQVGTSFRIYRSTDLGETWTMVRETGHVNECTLEDQPDTGIVLYRIGAFNAIGESVRYTAGAWAWPDAPSPPSDPTGAGVQ